MNSSSCLVLVIAFFTLVAHADETPTEKVSASTVTVKIDPEEVSVDGNKVTEENTVKPPTAAPAAGGDEDKVPAGGKGDEVPAEGDGDDASAGGDEDNTPINRSHTSCGSLSLAVGVVMLSRW